MDMYPLVLFVVALHAGGTLVMSAPSDQLSACMAITQEDAQSMATCCNYSVPFSNQTMINCQKKDASGELQKEFECIPDCLFSSDGLLTDKKFDKDKWKQNAEKTLPNDWKNVIAESPDKCGEFEKIMGPQMPKQCPTTNVDMMLNCMSIQWYLHCPGSAWTSSRSCNDTREKFGKCYEFMFPK